LYRRSCKQESSIKLNDIFNESSNYFSPAAVEAVISAAEVGSVQQLIKYNLLIMPLVKQLILLIVIEIQILMFVSVIQLLMIVIEMNIVKNESQILFFEIEIQSLNLESEPKIHTFVSEIQFVSGILLIFVVEIQFLISETQKQMLSQFILFMIATIGPGNTWKFRRWTGLVANAHMHLNHHYCYYLPLLPMLRWLPLYSTRSIPLCPYRVFH
jgi:hypothetical protein